MTLKLFFRSIILLVIGFCAGWMTDTVQKNLQTVDNVAVLLKDLQTDMQALERELSKKTGIELTSKNRQASHTEAAFAKAETLVKQGQLITAGLYFSHGLSQDPGEWAWIQRYQQSVLNYCHQLLDQGQYETVLNMLTEIENFLRSQAATLNNLPEIEQLEQTLSKVADLKQVTIQARMQKSRAEATALLAKSEELLTQAEKDPTQAAHSVEAFKDTLVSLHAVDTSLLEEAEATKLNQQVARLDKTIANLDRATQTVATISTLAQRAEQFIDKAKAEPVQSKFILYYLTSAEALIGQLVLFTPEQETAKTQVATLSQHLEEAKQVIAKSQSQVVWNELEQAFSQIKITDDSKAQEVIDKLTKFRQLLGERANKLSSMEYLEKAQALLEKVNTLLTDWQHYQLRRYEHWAMQRIKEFYSSATAKLGTVKNDKVGIYRDIMNYLSEIDVRYLSQPANTAYGEVFNMFYAKLDNDQKIPLSSEMTLAKKVALSVF